MKNYTLLLLVMMVACGAPSKPGQKTYSAPEDAVVATIDAARAGNTAELSAIFGPDGQKILASGDPVMDQLSVQAVLAAYDERAQLMEEDGKRILLTGAEKGQVVEASLHEDVAAEMLKTVAEAQRVTIKCFCEGLNQHVRLKSCVAADPSR